MTSSGFFLLFRLPQPSPQMCEGMCRDAGGDTFGVQYGRQCFCGDSRDTDIEKHGRTMECDMPCSGDASVTCGGRECTPDSRCVCRLGTFSAQG